MMSGSTASSNSTVCVCTRQRLEYYGCLCGAELARWRKRFADPRFICSDAAKADLKRDDSDE